jgi:NhaP-type Na+/H+ or K+/H+ antiporter
MKRQGETRMLLFVMTGMAFLFVAAVVPLSGFSIFLAAQVIAITAAWISSRPLPFTFFIS